MGTVDLLTSGRDAFAREAWAEAVEVFTAAEEEESLGPDDLVRLSNAAWWIGQADESIDALERAFRGYVDGGDRAAAAIVAVRLAYLAARRNAMPIAMGWIGQAQQLLEDLPESPAHAWLKLMYFGEAFFNRYALDEALQLANEALEISRRQASADTKSLAESFKAQALIFKGDWREGMTLVDESTAAAVTEDLDLWVASDIYCNTIAACRNLGDYGRAGEWTEEADRWMRRHSVGGYPGVCRVHRAELKRLRGAWSEAEQEARHACEELEKFRLLDSVGLAYYEIGEVRLRMGDLEAADESFSRAYEYGSGAQPGLALLALAKGEADEAAESIARSLSGRGRGEDEGSARNLLSRARLLPAQVQIALAREDVETVRAATEELETVTGEFERPAFEAAALVGRGGVGLLEGDPEAAAECFDKSWRLWRDIGFPYESAQARTLLGRAHAAAGNDTTARMDLKAARSAFQKLGAARDVEVLNEMLGDDAVAEADGRRVTKTFMFTDIVTSTDLVGLIGDGAWEELLNWHNRALRSAFAEHRGEEVRHTGDGFFVTFEQAADAIECAVAIQRRLAEHRREHGFAPWVRIGFHTTEATPQGSDYSGRGVHVAARVGALADKEEIVLSAASLEAAGTIRFPVSDGREATLKGVSEPVEVFTIDWR